MFVLIFLLILPIYSSSQNLEIPYSLVGSAKERHSPSDWIKEEQIKVYKDRVIIEIPDAEWAKFTDTNSMDPVLDKTANAIEIVPKNYDDLKKGDIISYSIPNVQGIIIHRIVETGFDEDGWYAITKGDNVEKNDPLKIRFENIKRVVVAIIY
jgi:hypothetical protein